MSKPKIGGQYPIEVVGGRSGFSYVIYVGDVGYCGSFHSSFLKKYMPRTETAFFVATCIGQVNNVDNPTTWNFRLNAVRTGRIWGAHEAVTLRRN